MTPGNLKKWRNQRGLTQKQCSQLIYVSLRHWQRIESTETPIHASQCALLTLRTDKSANFRRLVERKLTDITEK